MTTWRNDLTEADVRIATPDGGLGGNDARSEDDRLTITSRFDRRSRHAVDHVFFADDLGDFRVGEFLPVVCFVPIKSFDFHEQLTNRTQPAVLDRLPKLVRERRLGEIDSDIWEQTGLQEASLGAVLIRYLRGVPDDLLRRVHLVRGDRWLPAALVAFCMGAGMQVGLLGPRMLSPDRLDAAAPFFRDRLPEIIAGHALIAIGLVITISGLAFVLAGRINNPLIPDLRRLFAGRNR